MNVYLLSPSQCMDFGFHNCIARALLMHCSAEEGKQRSLQSGAEQLAACVGALDSRADKQRFLESHHAAFMIPKKFEFQGQRGDEVRERERGRERITSNLVELTSQSLFVAF